MPALDLAVAFHFPEIMEELLLCGAVPFGGVRRILYLDGFPTFHMIGHPTQCFARYVIHGTNHRAALRETIHILQERDLDINATDAWDRDKADPPIRNALSKALENPWTERYILEELIEAGAAVDEIAPERDNAATFIARQCEDHLFNDSTLELMLRFVENLDQPDRTYHTALHHCASGGSWRMAEVLLKTKRVDINATSEMGRSALFLACMHGNAAVAEVLIEHGANIELPDSSNDTPLQKAVRLGQLAVVDILLNHGAKTRFYSTHRGHLTGNILHDAVMDKLPTTRTSAVGHLLESHPNLAEEGLVNEFNSSGWTPMHQAAYYGDVQGVKDLVAAGADQKLKDKRSYKDLRSGTPGEIAQNNMLEIEENGLHAKGDYDWLDGADTAAINHFRNSLQEIWRILANLDLKDTTANPWQDSK
ncbi:hypothetical protein SLS56_002452 [Neofusicoccum ribis]|uniref:Ankyrin repeat protein n=1 Tax=Neofusicoccum ribis TaxID=45134 RepID=A0ABR3T3M2_9PEZI